jgi:hypothetical protein
LGVTLSNQKHPLHAELFFNIYKMSQQLFFPCSVECFFLGGGASFCPFSQQKVGNSLGYFGFPRVNSTNFAIFWEIFLQFFNVVKLGEQNNPD